MTEITGALQQLSQLPIRVDPVNLGDDPASDAPIARATARGRFVPTGDSFGATVWRNYDAQRSRAMAGFDQLWNKSFLSYDPVGETEFAEIVGNRNLIWQHGIDRQALTREIEAYDRQAVEDALESAGVDRMVARFAGTMLGQLATPQGAAGAAASVAVGAAVAPIAGPALASGTWLQRIAAAVGVEAFASLPEVLLTAQTETATGQREYGDDDLMIDLGLAAPFAAAGVAFGYARQARQAKEARRTQRPTKTAAPTPVDNYADKKLEVAQERTKIQSDIVALKRKRVRRQLNEIGEPDLFDKSLRASDRKKLKQLDERIARAERREDMTGVVQYRQQQNDIWADVIDRAESALEGKVKKLDDAEVKTLERALRDLDKREKQISKNVSARVKKEVAAREVAEKLYRAQQSKYDEWQAREAEILATADGPAIQDIMIRAKASGLDMTADQAKQLIAAAKSLDYDKVLREYAKVTVRKGGRSADLSLRDSKLRKRLESKVYDDEVRVKSGGRTKRKEVKVQFSDALDSMIYAAGRGDKNARTVLERYLRGTPGVDVVSDDVFGAMVDEAVAAFMRRARTQINKNADWPGSVIQIQRMNSTEDLIGGVVDYTRGLDSPPEPPIDLGDGASNLSDYATYSELAEIQAQLDRLDPEIRADAQLVFDELQAKADELEKVLVSPVCGFK